jgi:hypothetical protein
LVDIIGLFKSHREITVEEVYKAYPDVRPDTIKKRVRDLVYIGFVAAANTKNGRIYKDTVLSLTDKTFDVRMRTIRLGGKKCPVSV